MDVSKIQCNTNMPQANIIKTIMDCGLVHFLTPRSTVCTVCMIVVIPPRVLEYGMQTPTRYKLHSNVRREVSTIGSK